VQVVSALIAYEAVTFADYDRNRLLMNQCFKVAEKEYEQVIHFGKMIKDSLEEKLFQEEAYAIDIVSHHSGPTRPAPPPTTTTIARAVAAANLASPTAATSRRTFLDIKSTYLKHSTHCERLAQAVLDYYKTVQQEIQKTLVSRLVLVGLLQNALQTKVQISMFGLNYNLTRKPDKLFFIGVAGNLMSYFFGIIEFLEFFELVYNYFEDSSNKMADMLKSEYVTLEYKQFDIRRLRQKRIRIAYIFGVLFGLVYMMLWVYLLVNFIMTFVCPNHLWNINFNVPEGCVKVNKTLFGRARERD